MKMKIISALLLGCAAPALAQNTLDNTSISGSGAEANSGSVSGASSDNQNANIQGQTLNGNIGTSRSESESTAVSGSSSGAASISDQAQGQNQGQSQDARNSQSQSNDANTNQGQSQGQTLTATQGQQATNSQGVQVSNTFNSTEQKTKEIRTNNAVPLTSSTSFSSDYCGGTVSGGASAAPIGISIGGSAPKMDKTCQALRRAEKFGIAAANAHNMGQPELGGRLMSMMIWSICTADGDGPRGDQSTAQACDKLALLGELRDGVLVPGHIKPETKTEISKGKNKPGSTSAAVEAMNRDTVLAASLPPKP